VAIRKTEKIRGNTRLEFVCGLRALRHARADFRTLQELSRQLSAPAAETPALVATQLERVKALEKANQRLGSEIAQREGRELWAATAPGADGIRRVVQWVDIDDALRTRAQAFVGEGKAAFLAVSLHPPLILLAASADSGIHAGERVKAAVSALGGRGGGSQGLAQGSLPVAVNMDAITETLW
jgi:alanyl-tRNA synthetase